MSRRWRGGIGLLLVLLLCILPVAANKPSTSDAPHTHDKPRQHYQHDNSLLDSYVHPASFQSLKKTLAWFTVGPVLDYGVDVSVFRVAYDTSELGAASGSGRSRAMTNVSSAREDGERKQDDPVSNPLLQHDDSCPVVPVPPRETTAAELYPVIAQLNEVIRTRDNTIVEFKQDLKLANRKVRDKDRLLMYKSNELADAKHKISNLTLANQRAYRDYQHDRGRFQIAMQELQTAANKRIFGLFLCFWIAVGVCWAQYLGKVPERFLHVRKVVQTVLVHCESCSVHTQSPTLGRVSNHTVVAPELVPLPPSPSSTITSHRDTESSDEGSEDTESSAETSSAGTRRKGREGKGPVRLEHRKEKRKEATARKNAIEKEKKAEARIALSGRSDEQPAPNASATIQASPRHAIASHASTPAQAQAQPSSDSIQPTLAPAQSHGKSLPQGPKAKGKGHGKNWWKGQGRQ